MLDPTRSTNWTFFRQKLWAIPEKYLVTEELLMLMATMVMALLMGMQGKE